MAQVKDSNEPNPGIAVGAEPLTTTLPSPPPTKYILFTSTAIPLVSHGALLVISPTQFITPVNALYSAMKLLVIPKFEAVSVGPPLNCILLL